ncbi:ankyrin repeat protein, partial [Ostertagia ostertagi]
MAFNSPLIGSNYPRKTRDKHPRMTHEKHACKNGLAKHVEHLLFYGAVVDAENVNGNTPLHVCSVNNRPDCARVLLFRGANHLAVNKQGQTALAALANYRRAPLLSPTSSLHTTRLLV